jgi:hypothetical protein
MNTMSDSKNIAKAGASGKIRMTPSEAFVETLVAQGVKDTFGIVGSAYMDAHDLFPLAGIRFLSVAHEQNAAHMADGYSRVTGKHGVCIAQNGPGITNFVTGIAAAYWAHSPVVCVTPESGSMSMGLGGFQETEQMPIFSKITKWQVHVNSPLRIAELTGRAFDIAMAERGPVQVNIPRDYFYGEGEYDIPQPHKLERGAGGPESLDAAARMLAKAKFPVILSGGGVIMAGGIGSQIMLTARGEGFGATQVIVKSSGGRVEGTQAVAPQAPQIDAFQLQGTWAAGDKITLKGIAKTDLVYTVVSNDLTAKGDGKGSAKGESKGHSSKGDGKGSNGCHVFDTKGNRSEERRVGKECSRRC